MPVDAFEVLVIDNGSSDNTHEIVEQFSDKLESLRYFYEAEPGLHVGRHRGMLEARGDILVFADDDIEALPTWLSSIQEAFMKSDVAMVGGNNIPMFMTSPPQWLQYIWQNPIFGNKHYIPSLSIQVLDKGIHEINPNQVWGCNFSIRKEHLLAAGGFHPDGMPQELIAFRGDGETHVSRYISERNLKSIFHPGASVYHKVTTERMTFKYFRQRGFNQGVSDSYTQLRNKNVNLNLSWFVRFKLMIKFLINIIRSFMRSLIMPSDVKKALNELKIGHKEGFLYHQNSYFDDPDVRAWVHRENYFDFEEHQK